MEAQEDTLGLDKPMKLGRVSKFPKITDELLFNPTRGLPQITKNYKKLSRSIKKNDKRLHDKLKTETSKMAVKRAKVEAEFENLGNVIQFYQFWCHGFFPRANFNDCIRMLRTYKSARLKEYRRSLLDNELHKLKVAKGIITEGDEEQGLQAELDNDDLYAAPGTADGETSSVPQANLNNGSDLEEDDGDWGFMNVNGSNTNGLFIGDDDNDLESERPVDRFDDAQPKPQEYDEYPPEDDIEDDYEEEFAAMREMGM
ncbi:hypothetical protein FT663_01792 [Candidozyma haemuli var. vulneris]|uniref:Chromosome segregation in meiosis protein 3 domain-containing protein n=1 Tax=Candidozyma haemuli TaxID=45357 RepID=A0A2V1B1K1_9ASCO|nr:hypothetical protein CXQ85_002869 [[Candida] haemuloni]KAF3991085.1 hypothetical protein FT662_01913 [[Candida] haemuloni var. vulneris]KAF3993624.1 hypothetical protein FT663_01792 [[Candida] haemuloni var. vulneris]PVH23141.1 hypothetical protein CXQ85_002869 [[Candida] haemuloni]